MFEPGKLQYLLEEPLKAARAKTQIDTETFPGAKDIATGYPRDFGGALKRALVLQANAVSGSSPILISEGV